MSTFSVPVGMTSPFGRVSGSVVDHAFSAHSGVNGSSGSISTCTRSNDSGRTIGLLLSFWFGHTDAIPRECRIMLR
jgi:hypothetical protein